MKKKGLIIGMAVVCAALAVCIFVIVFLNGNSAKTIKLFSFEGIVRLFDSKGKDIEVSEGRRLLDGNVLDTEDESKARILLDEDRMVTVMENSSVGFCQNGKKISLVLTDGNLFFDIEKSLEEKESFEIKISTMIIGIRGTSGYVDADEDGNGVLYLTTGKVEVTGLDDQGRESGSDKLKAGQKITAASGDEAGLIVEDVTEYDLPYELIEFILSDDDLLGKILDETGWDKEILEARLSSGEDGSVEDASGTADTGYVFDVSELNGTWYEDGVKLFTINGDGGGTLFYPSDGMFDSDPDSLVPITMTYDAFEGYMMIKDPVHYPSGLVFDYLIYDGQLVLYDGLYDKLAVKEGSADPGNGWRSNPVSPARADL